jgi:hypothetical protein
MELPLGIEPRTEHYKCTVIPFYYGSVFFINTSEGIAETTPTLYSQQSF